MSIAKFGNFNATETDDGFFIECDFFAQSTNESFPIYVTVNEDGSFLFHDNGFLKNDYGTNEFALAGIKLVATAFGFEFDGEKVSALAKTKEEKETVFGNLLSVCYSIESTLSDQGGNA